MKVVLKLDGLWPDVTNAIAAKELGVTEKTVTNLRKGTERGSWETLVRLSQWLSRVHGRRVEIEDLLCDEDSGSKLGEISRDRFYEKDRVFSVDSFCREEDE